MAGSGKTTLVDALSAWLDDLSAASHSSAESHSSSASQLDSHILDAIQSMSLQQASSVAPPPPCSPPPSPSSPPASPPASSPAPTLPGHGAYVINLDPAVYELPYEPNIDIRDTIKYKQVMSQYELGPNAAIITSLNLYATRFDQVLSLIEKRAPHARAVVIDTPGQIETFTWSASGTIITDALGITLPTVILFVMDTVRCENTMTFVSNMLYACSIMYKTRLPMVMVFNKSDVKSAHFAQQWMRDYDKLQADLQENNFLGTLARSMAQALEQFYHTLRSVAVSAHTGDGMQQLVESIHAAAQQYEAEYRPVVEARLSANAQQKRRQQQEQLERVRADIRDERNVEEQTTTKVFADKHSVRLAKMTATYYDEQEEERKYDELMRDMHIQPSASASAADAKRDGESQKA